MAEDLEKLRRQLKDYEADFVKENGRKPGKADIDGGAPEVKELYRKYGTQKKKQALDGVWGAHLNKKAIQTDKDEREEAEKETKKVSTPAKSKPSFMSKLGQKLLQNSAKVSTSPSLKRDKKSSVFGKNLSDEKLQTSSNNDPVETVPLSPFAKFPRKNGGDISFKVVEKSTKVPAKLPSPPSPTEVFSTKKMTFLSSSFLTKFQDAYPEKENDGFDAPGTFAFRQDTKSPEDHFKASFLSSEDSNSFISCSQNPVNFHGKPKRTSFLNSPKVVVSNGAENRTSSANFQTFTENANDGTVSAAAEKDGDTRAKSVSQKTDFSITSDNVKEGKKETKNREDFTELSKVETAETEGNKRKRKRLRSCGEEYEMDEASTEIAVTWRPDSRTETLMIDLDSESQPFNGGDPVPADSQPEEDEPHAAKKRKTVEKKLNNDNFVRLNMKLKGYRRKGKGMTGGQYKRMQWKQKMASRSESVGKDTCFKCGGTGHWASKCRGNRNGNKAAGKTISGEKNTVNDADFPSMRDAVNMARGIKLKKKDSAKVAKDKAAEEKVENGEKEEEDEDEDEDDELFDVIREGFDLPTAPPPMEPLYQVNEDGTLPETPKEVYTALEKFGYTSFRPGQEKAVMRVLCGLSTLMVLSTGSGKSLCYQLPAYMYAQKTNCITLVICPLISLMEDQVSGLPPGIHGACLHYNMTPAQRDTVMEDVAEGRLHFLLVSPETLVGGGGAAGSAQLFQKLPQLAFACIDEAHCVSEWSHHFRPSYLRICKVLKERFGIRCLLGLTATATMVTAASVSQHLGIKDFATATIRGVPVPSNLQLSVSRDEDRDQALINLLQGERFQACYSIIVYCTRREQTERVATIIRTNLKELKPDDTLLKQDEEEESSRATAKKKAAAKKSRYKAKGAGWTAESYHAGMSSSRRKSVQNAFMCGKLRVVVATVAFGMGLDKADVRAVVHYSLPKSFESYVQEIGRSGRDGKPAHCHLFLDPLGGDMNELRKHTYANTVDRITIKRLCQSVFPSCKCRKSKTQAKKDLGFDDDGIDYSQLEEFKTKSEQLSIQPAYNVDEEETISRRICAGHERAVPIETTVQGLDMKEEGISTLLCYLELHEQRWVRNLQPVYATCRLQCYGGPAQLSQVAQKCPPVAVAIAQEKRRGVSHSKTNNITFSAIDVSDIMGWNSAAVKRELKLLQWNQDPTGMSGPAKTGVLAEFTDLAFHLYSPGDLTDEELDEVVEFLHERVQTQEKTELYQLDNFHNILKSYSHKNVWMCSEECDQKRSVGLKASILDYFDRQPCMDNGQISMISFSREGAASLITDQQVECENEASVRGDIRAFIQLYGSEHQLSGRVIARMFYGISSPCFPAEVWGRVRRFWRCHMDKDFNVLRKLATQELIRMK